MNQEAVADKLNVAVSSVRSVMKDVRHAVQLPGDRSGYPVLISPRTLKEKVQKVLMAKYNA